MTHIDEKKIHMCGLVIHTEGMMTHIKEAMIPTGGMMTHTKGVMIPTRGMMTHTRKLRIHTRGVQIPIKGMNLLEEVLLKILTTDHHTAQSKWELFSSCVPFLPLGRSVLCRRCIGRRPRLLKLTVATSKWVLEPSHVLMLHLG